MYEIQKIKQTALREAKAHPQLAASIMDSARTSLGRIASGESPRHELECFLGRLDELKVSV